MEAATEGQVAGGMQQQVETERTTTTTGVEGPAEGGDGGSNRSNSDKRHATEAKARGGSSSNS